jgi:hypothetical protein
LPVEERGDLCLESSMTGPKHKQQHS